MRLRLLTFSLLAAGGLAAPGLAAPHKTQAAGVPSPNTIVAVVGSHDIHLGDLNAAAAELPPQARNMPPQQLYPLLLDQLIDRQALAIAARKQGLENTPEVKTQLEQAENNVLTNALLRRDIAPQLTEQNLRALYDKEVGTKPGEPEVQASHILVATEAQAKDIIAQLNKGADFATLAKKYSTDPSGKDSGGDLGYFKRGDMVPEFSAAAFALKPGQITQTPVHTRYGWHVIKVVSKRQAPPPTFDQAKAELQQQIVHQAIEKEVDKAKQGLKVVRYNSDGSPATGAPTAVPSPAAPAGK